MLDSKNFTLNQIAKWLGHSSIRTLISVYNNFIEENTDDFSTNFDVFVTKKVTEKIESA